LINLEGTVMSRRLRNQIIGAAAIVFAVAPATFAEETSVGDLRIQEVWARATAPGAPAGAAYMTLSALGEEGDRLIRASSPIADLVNLHSTQLDDGIMRMVGVPIIEVPAGGTTVLEPGSFHVMMLGLQQQLVEGEQIPLSLEFEHAGLVEITVTIAGPGATGLNQHGGHGADVAAVFNDAHNHDAPETAAADHGTTEHAATEHEHDAHSDTVAAATSGGQDTDGHGGDGHGDTHAAENILNLKIVNRELHEALELSGGVPVLRIKQGEATELTWTTDEGTQLHLHGYDIDLDLTPGTVGRMMIPANFAGRFAVEAHSFAGIAHEHSHVVESGHGDESSSGIDTAADGHHIDDPEEREATSDEVVILYVEVLP
jgi:copper(I)-binding protein